MATDDETLVEQEHSIWKKNSVMLYDTLLTQGLEWPSLTVEWLPDYTPLADHGSSKQRLVIGTHTSDDEPNYLQIMEVRMPLNDEETNPEESEKTRKISENGNIGVTGTMKEILKIPHDQEVNRARYNPKDSFIIATKSPSSDVFIFDYRSISSRDWSKVERSEIVCTPDLILKGHADEGYGLAWSPKKDGYLLSGSDDKRVCVWDIQTRGTSAPGKGSSIDALQTFNSHTDVVEDVAWSHHHEHLFGSVGDDRRLLLWDLRSKETKPYADETIHSAEINCLEFSPFQEYLFATGSADQTVALWDMRNLNTSLHTFASHEDEVTQLQWSPFNESILASAAADRRLNVWDLSRIGMEQTPEDAEDGPAELLFMHGGHTGKISDFSWNLQEDWTVASVAEDNIIQVWQMASNVYADDPYIPTDAELEA